MNFQAPRRRGGTSRSCRCPQVESRTYEPRPNTNTLSQKNIQLQQNPPTSPNGVHKFLNIPKTKDKGTTLQLWSNAITIVWDCMVYPLLCWIIYLKLNISDTWASTYIMKRTLMHRSSHSLSLVSLIYCIRASVVYVGMCLLAKTSRDFIPLNFIWSYLGSYLLKIVMWLLSWFRDQVSDPNIEHQTSRKQS